MISMFTCTARSLRSTLESMATPCSVKAYGGLRAPPQLEVTNCGFKLLNSLTLSWNMKSWGIEMSCA